MYAGPGVHSWICFALQMGKISHKYRAGTGENYISPHMKPGHRNIQCILYMKQSIRQENIFNLNMALPRFYSQACHCLFALFIFCCCPLKRANRFGWEVEEVCCSGAGERLRGFLCGLLQRENAVDSFSPELLVWVSILYLDS